VVVALVRAEGVEAVLGALQRAAPALAVVLVLEGLVILCDAASLRQLYAAPRPAWSRIVRATLVGYPVASLAPAGRTIAEGLKAALLTPGNGGARAALAAGRIQGIVLLSASVASIAAAGPAFLAFDSGLAGWAIAGNAALTGALGFGVLAAGRHLGVGGFLGRRWARASTLGPEVDALWRAEPLVPATALALQVLGRALVMGELGVVLAALGPTSLPQIVLASGVFLVGTSVGDLVPAQVGVTEAHFVLTSSILAIPASDAVVLPMFLRASQLAWSTVGMTLPLLWPAQRES
jgi:hypothetical protein